MEPIQVLFLAGFVLFFGLFSEWLFVKTHISDVFWMLLLGVVLQFTVPGARITTIDPVSSVFITFALLFISFESAYHIQLQHAAAHFVAGCRMSLRNFVAALILGALFGKLVGLSWPLALILGCIAPTLSDPILGQFQNFISFQKGADAILEFESQLTDVLAVLGVVSILSFANFTLAGFLNQALTFLILSAAIGFLVALFWAKVLKSWITTHSYILTIAFLMLVYTGTEYIGANGSIAAMAFALTFGNLKKITSVFSRNGFNGAGLTTSAKNFYSEISFLLRSYLFVWMGLITSFAMPSLLLIGTVLCMMLFVIRAYLVRFMKNIAEKDRVYISVLFPKDITPLVLASLPLQAGMAQAHSLLTITLGLILSSVVVTSFLVFLVRHDRFHGFDVHISHFISRFRKPYQPQQK